MQTEQFFRTIVGFDDLKEQMRFSLNGGPVVHWLLHGPPGTAKTMFLLEVMGLPGARYFMGGNTSKAGLADVLVDFQPRYVLIDEIEKMQPEHLSTLLSLMETGWVRIDKARRHESVRLPNTRVVAAANKTHRLPPELLSRFVRVHVPPYGQGDFIKVVVRVLVLEGLEPDFAQAVASRLWNSGITDVRQARSIARLAGGDKARVQGTIEFLQKYR